LPDAINEQNHQRSKQHLRQARGEFVSAKQRKRTGFHVSQQCARQHGTLADGVGNCQAGITALQHAQRLEGLRDFVRHQRVAAHIAQTQGEAGEDEEDEDRPA